MFHRHYLLYALKRSVGTLISQLLNTWLEFQTSSWPMMERVMAHLFYTWLVGKV